MWVRAEVFSMGTDKGGEGRRRGQDPGVLWVGGQVEVTGGMLPGPPGRSPVLTLHPSSSYVVARVPFHQLLKDLSGTRLNKTPSSFSGRRRQSVFLIFKHQLLVIVGPHWFLPSML